MRAAWKTTLMAVLLVGFVGVAAADDLTIYEIQSNTSDGDASIYSGQIHNVTGGIVTHIAFGGRPRVWIQDPTRTDWAGLVIKDWHGGEFAGAVQVGDWVDFGQILIEEYRGGTFLQYNKSLAPNVTFTVNPDPGIPVPDPLLLTAADLVVPVNHPASEPYESMLATLEDVVVGQMDLGKAADNYELLQGAYTAWGADYLNIDAGGPYHPYIYTGAQLDSITGIVEQYTKPEDGWDYYQLCTRFTADIVPEPGTSALLAAGLLLGRRRR